ncbi:sensor histidine kinase [Perlabentimonas gracilis]|uniref:sensor histidine kinase n=1 Tax=Perlabentimonas gracilis TaxID=2715279 RepID=UPI001408208F|nr:ATP-binding protein [Perlabentimonas gracilis]
MYFKILKHIYILVVLTIHTFSLYSQEQGLPIIRNYSPTDYGSTPQVLTVVQGKSGIMYFGLASQIIEYDGVTWRKNKTGKGESPYGIHFSDNDRIYVAGGTEFGYFTSDKQGKSYYKTLTHLLTDTSVYTGSFWNIKATSKSIYFQAQNAIVQYDKHTGYVRLLKNETYGQYAPGFVHNDVYYIHLKHEGLIKIIDGEIVPAYELEMFNEQDPVYTGVSLNKDTLILATQNSNLFTFIPQENTTPQKITLSNSKFLQENSISRIEKFNDKLFTAGTMKKGVSLIEPNGEIIHEYNRTTLLQNNYARFLSVDSNKNIWISLSRGISKTEQSTDLTYWGEGNGLEGIVEYVTRYNGTLYITTHQNVYYIDTNNQLQIVKNIEPGINWEVLSTQNPKSLLLGSQNGIYEINGGSAKLIARGNHACALHQSRVNPKRVYSILNETFVSLKYEKNQWVLEGEWEGINANIRGIIESDDGEIWLGTFRNGVIRVTPDPNNITQPLKHKRYTLDDGFKSLMNILPFQFKDKIIWGTATGLFTHNNSLDVFEPYCDLGEQFCNGSTDVFHFKQMPDGKIWIIPLENSKADIGFLEPTKDGDYKWNFTPFRRIPHMLLVAFYPEESGVIWIGGSEGLYRYDMANDSKDYTRKFNTYVRKVYTKNDSVIYYGSKLDFSQYSKANTPPVLKYSSNSLEFEYAAPFFDFEERTLYSYKLEGFDQDWSQWSRQTEKEYTNLREGEYAFKVKARNIYDVESSIDTFSIIIQPPFYRTIWAYLLYLLAAVTLIWLIVKVNTKRLKAENTKLERVVQERTSDLSEVNTQLEEKQAELEIRQEEITAQAEMLAATNAELEKLSIVASKTDNAVIIMDENFNFEWINEGFTKIYGLTFNELKSSHGDNLIIGSNYKNIAEVTKRCKETKTSVQYQNEVKRGNTSRWVQTTLTPIVDYNENVRKYVAIDSDITRIKSAEQSLKEQRDEIQSQNVKLKEMDEFKQGMTSMIVHDLKNPLNMILNIPNAFDPEKKDMAIKQSANQMLNMVLNILDVNKYEEVGMKFELKEKRLEPIGNLASEKVQFLCEQKAIILKNEIDPNITAWVDSEILERVFINLLTNAIKYSPIGESITIKSNVTALETVQISVTNKGEGISSDKKHLVFQKFGQIVAKKSGAVKSTGLGLAFCKMAIEAHSGKIDVDTAADGLTTFWFTLKMGQITQQEVQTVVKTEETALLSQPFTDEEIQVLQPVIKSLNSFTVYETDDVEEIISELESTDSININNWVKEMKQSITTLNQLKYLELLKIP